MDQAPDTRVHFKNEDGAPFKITEATLKAVRDGRLRRSDGVETGSDNYFIRPRIKLLNTTSRPITGFALYLIHGESNHKVYFERRQLRIEPNSSFTFLGFEVQMRLPGTPEGFSVSILGVAFEDGSEWGAFRRPTSPASASEAPPSAPPNHPTEPFAIHKVQPNYPASAKKSNVSGSVVVEMTVDKKGKVSSAEVLSGDPDLADAALEAARKWTFTPATLDGNPIQVKTRITFTFALARNGR